VQVFAAFVESGALWTTTWREFVVALDATLNEAA
jgi:hypothetical protein